MEASEAGNFITLNPAAPDPRQDQAVVCLTQVPSSCAALLTHQLVLPDRPAQGPRLALCRCAGALAGAPGRYWRRRGNNSPYSQGAEADAAPVETATDEARCESTACLACLAFDGAGWKFEVDDCNMQSKPSVWKATERVVLDKMLDCSNMELADLYFSTRKSARTKLLDSIIGGVGAAGRNSREPAEAKRSSRSVSSLNPHCDSPAISPHSHSATPPSLDHFKLHIKHEKLGNATLATVH